MELALTLERTSLERMTSLEDSPTRTMSGSSGYHILDPSFHARKKDARTGKSGRSVNPPEEEGRHYADDEHDGNMALLR